MKRFVSATLAAAFYVIMIFMVSWIVMIDSLYAPLPATAPFYSIGDFYWVGVARTIGNLATCVGLFFASVLIFATDHRLKVVTLATALMMLTTSAHLLALTLLIHLGGIWHGMTACTAIIESIVMVLGVSAIIWSHQNADDLVMP